MTFKNNYFKIACIALAVLASFIVFSSSTNESEQWNQKNPNYEITEVFRHSKWSGSYIILRVRVGNNTHYVLQNTGNKGGITTLQ